MALERRAGVPDALEALRDIWKSPLFAEASLGWLEKVTALNYSPLPDACSVPGFPKLRDRQRQAFGLLDREFGFLWGAPGTGKTYTVGAILASYLRQRPQARILLLSTTNWAVDIALLGRPPPKFGSDGRVLRHTGVTNSRISPSEPYSVLQASYAPDAANEEGTLSFDAFKKYDLQEYSQSS